MEDKNGTNELKFKIISFQFLYCLIIESWILFMIITLIYHETTDEKFAFGNFSEYYFIIEKKQKKTFM